jgi:outer membrane protein OmpA-like peptidoglycan-associated protein
VTSSGSRKRLFLVSAVLGACAIHAGVPAEIAAARVPLCAGLTIVTAVSQPEGDYESIKRVESVTQHGVRIKYSSEAMVKDELSDEPAKLVHATVYRSVRTVDLASASVYEQQFYDGLPEVIPGTTAIGTSSAVLQQLKSRGQSPLSIFIAFSGEPSMNPDDVFYVFNNKMDSTVARVERAPVLVPVILNDAPAQLPAIHAKGDFQGDLTEFYFLDDPANPITLQYRSGIGGLQHVEGDRIVAGSADGRQDRDVLQVVKIFSHCDSDSAASEPSAVEDSLARSGRALVYDIYFNFNSATLRPESDPGLRQIATALQRHPDWKLDVFGHTDNIGGDGANLTLSRQRAAAVKAALSARFHIDPRRLATSGYGASRPQDTNVTLAGRARNRRVELVRE